MIDDIDIVYLASKIPEDEKINIYQLVTKREEAVLNTTFENLTMINPNIMNFEDESIIEASGFKIQPEYELFKRLFDIIVSLILLILASPFMLITAILVKQLHLDQLFINKYVLRKIKRNFQSINFVP